jgi:diacylglycerol kinase family enzyme
MPPQFDRDTLPHAHFQPPLTWVISTLSGAGESGNFFREVILPALKNGRRNAAGVIDDLSEIDYVETDSEDFIANWAANQALKYSKNGTDVTVALLSGDGGIVELINGFASQWQEKTYHPPTVALLPFGTGNGLANSVGITKDMTEGLRTLYTGDPRPLPSFQVKFSPRASVIHQGKHKGFATSIYGSIVCSWGLHASLVADSDTEAFRKHGSKRFGMAFGELVAPADGSESHRYKGRVFMLKTNEAGSGSWVPLERTEHMYVVATLVSNFEEKFKISPASKPLDGKLRLVHFGPQTPDEASRLMGLAYQEGKHVDDPAVGYEEMEGLRIEFDEEDARWRRVCVDGKIFEVEKGGSIEVRMCPSEIIKLLVPRR